jgi:hypothetical protein
MLWVARSLWAALKVKGAFGVSPKFAVSWCWGLWVGDFGRDQVLADLTLDLEPLGGPAHGVKGRLRLPTSDPGDPHHFATRPS